MAYLGKIREMINRNEISRAESLLQEALLRKDYPEPLRAALEEIAISIGKDF